MSLYPFFGLFFIMIEKKRPVTTAIKAILLSYILYAAGHGCVNLYQAGRERLNQAAELSSKSKEYVEKKIEPIRPYLGPNQESQPAQHHQVQPKHLERIVGE